MNSTKFRVLKRCLSIDFPLNNNECILKSQYNYQVIKIMKQYQQKRFATNSNSVWIDTKMIM